MTFLLVPSISVSKNEHDLHHHWCAVKVNGATPWLSSTSFNYYNYFE